MNTVFVKVMERLCTVFSFKENMKIRTGLLHMHQATSKPPHRDEPQTKNPMPVISKRTEKQPTNISVIKTH